MSWRANIRDEIRATTATAPRPEGVVRLDANESPYPVVEDDTAAALAQHLARLNLHRYPEGSAAALRQEIAAGLGLTPEHVLLGRGTEELVRLLCATFSKLKLREPRPRVAYPLPSPSGYRTAVLSQGARPLEMSLKEDFGLDPLAMERHITGGHPNLLLFCRPNDPTGNLWSREEMEKVVKDHADIVVGVDETYFDYCGDTLLDLLPRFSQLVIIRSLSRVGLAGLRVAYLIGDPELIAEVHKVRPAFNVSTLDQEAALWLLQHTRPRIAERVAQTVAERARLTTALQAVEGITVWPSCGNFVLIRVSDGPGVARALLKRGVAVADVGDTPLTANCLRVSVGLPQDDDLLLQQLPEALANPEPAPPTSKHKQAEVVADASAAPGPGLPKFL
jgi:histidinol-phosphate aminotransferase